MPGYDHLGEIDAGHTARHDDIAEDQLHRRSGIDFGQCRLAAEHTHDGIAEPLDEAAGSDQDLGVVVDEEDQFAIADRQIVARLDRRSCPL